MGSNRKIMVGFAKVLCVLAVAVLSMATQTQSLHGLLQSYIGKKLILRHYGDAPERSRETRGRKAKRGKCDVAVEVEAIEIADGAVHVRMERIGYPLIAGKKNRCRGVWYRATMTILEVPVNATAKTVFQALEQVLQTPEAYLADYQINFASPSRSKAPPTSAKSDSQVEPAELLLRVNPTYSADAVQRKLQGKTVIRVTVGEDGHLYEPRVEQSAGVELDERALRVLPLWCYWPAHLDGKPAAVPTFLTFHFQLDGKK